MDTCRCPMEGKKSCSNECWTNFNLCSRTIILKILLAGDSFAAKWPEAGGWPELLAQKHDVINVAQAGVSEYKILRQIQNANLSKFDKIIVSHTSPTRVHTRKHPIHVNGLHVDCDLIYNDIIDRNSWLNPSLRGAQDWFKYHYDEDYQTDVYLLIRKEIRTILERSNYISITHMPISTQYALEHKNISFSTVWQKHRGTINHYTEKGNQIVYEQILDIINK